MINAIKLNHFFRNDINDIDLNQIKYKDRNWNTLMKYQFEQNKQL